MARTFALIAVRPILHRVLCSYEMIPNAPNNEDIPSIHSSPNETTLDIAGPITRSRAKQLEKEIRSQVNSNLMFRNDGVYEPAWDEDGFKPLDI